MKHLLQNHLRLLILAVATLFLSACSPSDYIGGGGMNDPIPCNALYVPTATLTAADISGQPLADFQISYNQWPAPTGVTNLTCATTSPCDLKFSLANRVVEIAVAKEGFQPTKLTVTTPSNECGNQLTERFSVVLKPIV